MTMARGMVFSLLVLVGLMGSWLITGCEQPTLSELGYVTLELDENGGNFSADYFNIAVMNELGFEKRTLLEFSDELPKSDFSWSPAGDKIAIIVGASDNNCHLRILSTDGSETVEIPNVALVDHALHSASWSPDGTRVVFSKLNAQDPMGGYELWAVNSDGSNLTRLTDLGGWARAASWSPDGTKILFAFSPAPGNGGGGIVTIDNNGDNLTYVKASENTAFYDSPAWSPDGQRIAYFAIVDHLSGQARLHVMDANGTDLLSVDELNVATYNFSNKNLLRPTWSPSGTQIAVVGIEENSSGELYKGCIVSENGAVATINLPQVMSMCWSPNGKKVAFDVMQVNLSGQISSNIYTANSSGTGLTRLTYDQALCMLPAWKN